MATAGPSTDDGSRRGAQLAASSSTSPTTPPTANTNGASSSTAPPRSTTGLTPTNTVTTKDGLTVRARIEPTLPVDDVVRLLCINLKMKDPPGWFALRDENDELVTNDNLRKKILGKVNLKLVNAPAIEAADLVEKLASRDQKLAYTLNSLRKFVKEEQFAKEFLNRDGLRELIYVINGSHGNILAYALTAMQHLMELDHGWGELDDAFILRVVQILSSEQSLINVCRPATAILKKLVEADPAAAPGPHVGSSKAPPPPPPGSVYCYGFEVVYQQMKKESRLLETVVNRLGSADTTMALYSDIHWEEFFDKLQRLHVHKAVIGLMSSHTIEDLTSCILDFQANVVRMTHRKKTCLVDPEMEPAHAEALNYIWMNSRLKEETDAQGGVLKWRKLGFDTEDIMQEFSEVGVWGLDCFRYFVAKDPDYFSKVVQEQLSRPEERRCPIAKASNEVVDLLSEHWAIFGPGYSTSTTFQPFFLNAGKVHALATHFFLRMWNESGASRGDFPRVVALARSQVKVALRKENVRPWHEVEAEFLECEYRAVRDRQMQELEAEDDVMSKVPVRNLKAKLYKESFEFVRQQRIHCLLQGAWFMNALPMATNVPRDTIRRPTRPWRFIRLDSGLRYLHYVDSAVKFVVRNGLEDLPERIDISLINEIATGSCAPFPNALGGEPNAVGAGASPMQASPLSFALLSAGGGMLAAQVAPDQSRWADWTDGLNMLRRDGGHVASQETEMFVQALTEIGLKVRLLNLSGDMADIPSGIVAGAPPANNAVTWDPHSLFIHGQRTFILSAEVHPWRQPNPELWADILQKVRANGFNTVSIYVNWALHYPTPDTNKGQGDFQTGTYRDVQRFIDEVKKAGLWLIARPGPYINGETTGGGFPGWLGNIAGSLRTDNANYKAGWTPYMTRISQIIAKNQVTNGGPIILVQAENEFSAGSGRSDYMQDIIDLHRANGVTVPITHNDQHAGATGNFSPDLPGTGRVNIYCGDSYPQGSSHWSQPQAVYYSNHEAVAHSNPLCLAEFGGGFLLGWGSVGFGGTGYEKYSGDLTNATYENVFYKDTYAQTTTILNVYMLYGGTNWGQTLEPTVYSSYDYGGGINENRVATTKMNEMRLQGLFLRVARDLLGSNMIANGTTYTSSSLVYTTELRNPDTNGAFYIVRHNDATSEALTTTKVNISTSAGALTIPQTGDLTLDGRESKILVTDFVFGQSNTRVLYSTAEIMTWTTINNQDYIIIYAPSKQTGETVLAFSSQPSVDTTNAIGVNASATGNNVTLNYSLGDPAFTNIRAGGKTVVVVTMQKETALNWHAVDIPGSGTFGNYFSIGTNQSVLVGGPYLVRTASLEQRTTLALTGDLDEATDIEIIAPSLITAVSWNDQKLSLKKTGRSTYTASLSAPRAVQLPSLNPLKWKVSGSLPEISPDFNDSSFIAADQTTTNYTNLLPLAGDHVLYSQQYGFYGGNLIWRGHFNASGQETAFNLTVQGGLVFGYSAFLNGVFLGSSPGSTTASVVNNIWQIANGTLRVGQDNVLTVLQDHMGIVETSTSGGKEPRGIRGYSIIGGNTTFTQWKLQGNQGGAANAPDTVRGYLNEGGLWAERIGAHLPNYPDSTWATGNPLSGVKGAGVNFYRTTFNPNIPEGLDVPVRLSITPSDKSSNFRVQVYLNGWQLGKYINNIGPQTVFVLPAGILRPRSTNTLALSVWSLDASGATIAGLSLISDGTFSTASDIKDYTLPPDYTAQKHLRPAGKAQNPM
ncbi:hypothetical protein EIP91_006848 [Steccherinum ochraceum]|uniref:Beta-galactosidase n=1 Tax=Steccherinum ochraceum TaxID=92696 RepID=A0A4R0RQY8_9APHY|nr:hypothetical protein EIP91_006848 [Steccherinum ochraceum]